MTTINLPAVKDYLLTLQSSICSALEVEENGKKFITDEWQRAEGGGGLTRLIEGGEIIERGGVNFSHVFGSKLPPSASVLRPELAGCAFQAMGVSLVIHPRNPYAPTSHANVRLFYAETKTGEPIFWFGGGFDMTPYYGFEEDSVHWHTVAREACLPFGEDLYPALKKQCDEYFYLKHRQEARGIGGLFFDDFSLGDFDKSFAFMQSVGDHYIPAYLPLLFRRKNTPYGEREREFQCYRRGRYVEFNLIYDRGTLFGLQSQGRTESILMSLPSVVNWRYNWHPSKGSPEEKLYTDFLPARDWIDIR